MNLGQWVFLQLDSYDTDCSISITNSVSIHLAPEARLSLQIGRQGAEVVVIVVRAHFESLNILVSSGVPTTLTGRRTHYLLGRLLRWLRTELVLLNTWHTVSIECEPAGLLHQTSDVLD